MSRPGILGNWSVRTATNDDNFYGTPEEELDAKSYKGPWHNPWTLDKDQIKRAFRQRQERYQ